MKLNFFKTVVVCDIVGVNPPFMSLMGSFKEFEKTCVVIKLVC